MKKKKKRKFLSCINGVKGAISLFLAVLMTPFLTIAVLLVDVGRYNSAVSILDELMGVSSVSTLANYDRYLQERWGLMALSQGIDPAAVYQNNLEENGAIMGSTLEIENTSVETMYPLSDLEILESQLMEYCKWNVPTTIALDFFDLGDFIKNLEKKLSGYQNIASLLTNSIGAIDSGITLVESVEKLKESAKKLDDYKTDYENDYVDFESDTNKLLNNLRTIRNLENQLSTLNTERATLDAELQTLLEEHAQKVAAAQSSSDNSNGSGTGSGGDTATVEPPPEDPRIQELRDLIAAKDGEIQTVNGQLTEALGKTGGYRSDAQTAQTEYAQTLDDIAAELETYRKTMTECLDAVDSVQGKVMGMIEDSVKVSVDLEKKKGDLEEKQKDLTALKTDLENYEKGMETGGDSSYQAGLEYKEALEKDVEELETKIGELNTQKEAAKAASNGLDGMVSSLKTTLDTYSDATIAATIDGFKNLSSKVTNLNMSAVSADTALITRSNYKNIVLGAYVNEDNLDKFLEEQENELKNGALSALVDGLIAIYNGIMGVSVFVEDDLAACINTQYYSQNFGGLPGEGADDGGVLAVITQLGQIIKNAQEFKTNLVKLKLLKALKSLKALAESIVNLILALGNLILDILGNIVDLLTGYELWYTSTYCAYNLACRTDYNSATQSISAKTMTNYKLGKDSFPQKGWGGEFPIFGEIAALVSTITDYMDGTGSDLTFSGAELEYILFGSNSEIANQLYMFCVLYLIRFVLCIPSITANAEVQALAAAATLGYPVVIGLYLFLEPLVQTVLLVNGRALPFYSATVYLAPSGLPKLVNELTQFCDLTTAQSEKLTEKMIDSIAKSDEDYDYQKTLKGYETTGTNKDSPFDVNYREYCLIWLMLTVPRERQLARLSNLIQMETLYYYDNQGADYEFDLKKSHSFLSVKVEANIKQVMPSLADSSLFTIQRDHYRGY